MEYAFNNDSSKTYTYIISKSYYPKSCLFFFNFLFFVSHEERKREKDYFLINARLRIIDNMEWI